MVLTNTIDKQLSRFEYNDVCLPLVGPGIFISAYEEEENIVNKLISTGSIEDTPLCSTLQLEPLQVTGPYADISMILLLTTDIL